MANDWGPDNARPDASPDDVTKYDHLMPIGASRMRQIDEQILRRDERIAKLEADVERLIKANTELNDEAAQLRSWRWLDSTYDLQRRVYGHVLPMPPDTNELANYMQTNALAAVDEIMEMLGEVGWKPWASPRGWVRREHLLKEGVDVLHFIANMLCAAGVSDDEFWEAYRAKQVTNSRRQELGYDGVSGKCPGCRRSYDDEIKCVPAEPRENGDPAFCDHLNREVDAKE